MAGAIVVVVVVVVAALGWWWRSHPDLFPEAASSVSMSVPDWPVGQPIYVGMTNEPTSTDGVITLRAAEPAVVEDGAETQIDFLLCVIDPSSGVGGIGSVGADGIANECSTLTPVEGRILELNADPGQQVVMAVTPTTAGVVAIAGMKLSYSHGRQHGSQVVGEYLRLHAVD